MKMYEASYLFRPNIEVVEITKTSDKSVWFGKRRTARISDWHGFFETWDEAWTWLEMIAVERLTICGDRLAAAIKEGNENIETAKKRLAMVHAMKEAPDAL